MTRETVPPGSDGTTSPPADAVACTGLTYAFGDHYAAAAASAPLGRLAR
ncbi:hypothetical protein ACWGKA_37080 [Streptomyces luteogriseus]